MIKYFVLILVLTTPQLNAMELSQLLDRLDNVDRAKASKTRMEMSIKTEHWQRRLEFNVWTRGLDHALVRVTSPKKEKGTGTLRVKREMWNYLPKVNRVMKVPPSMMMGSWMGSDFSNDDLVKQSSLKNDYHASFFKPDPKTQALYPNHYFIRVKPKKETISLWGRIDIIMDKKDLVPVLQEFYDEKEKRMRIMKFSEVKQFGDRRIPAKITIIPLSKPGNMTIIRYLDATFYSNDDHPISKSLFSLRALKRRR